MADDRTDSMVMERIYFIDYGQKNIAALEHEMDVAHIHHHLVRSLANEDLTFEMRICQVNVLGSEWYIVGKVKIMECSFLEHSSS